MFYKCKKVQIILKLFVRIITLKKWFSTNEFVFDPGGFMNLSTLEDSYNSRTNHLQEGGNDMVFKRDSCANHT